MLSVKERRVHVHSRVKLREVDEEEAEEEKKKNQKSREADHKPRTTFRKRKQEIS
jgi:hypothetical protein